MTLRGTEHQVSETVLPSGLATHLAVAEEPTGTALPSVVAGPESLLLARARAMVRRIATGLQLCLSHPVQYVGRTGVLGVALLALAALCFFTANSALRQHQTVLRAELVEAQRNAVHQVAGQAAAPAAQLQSFVRGLPARSELPAITEQIVTQATGAGLLLERGSYDFTVTRSGQIVRARMSFPVQGSYPDIRKFIDGTLRAIPGAAVDGLRLERKNVASGEIAADIRFAVFLRNG